MLVSDVTVLETSLDSTGPSSTTPSVRSALCVRTALFRRGAALPRTGGVPYDRDVPEFRDAAGLIEAPLVSFRRIHSVSGSCTRDFVTHSTQLPHCFDRFNQRDCRLGENVNEHKIRFDNDRTRSPRDMFFFGMIENGLRGFDAFLVVAPDDDDIDDLDAYGIDWEELHNTDIMVQHNKHNAVQELDPEALDNPFSNDSPHKLSHVEVQEPLCPFGPEYVGLHDAHLAHNPHSQSCNMNSRRAVWIDALSFCRSLYD
ncbi:hypothetical protein B0H13DRAFT_2351761 [Mycena leptocephala]|nr:hypothetical protein B0H13DRAFT_2351761 [Mycena leptocephala]